MQKTVSTLLRTRYHNYLIWETLSQNTVAREHAWPGFEPIIIEQPLISARIHLVPLTSSRSPALHAKEVGTYNYIPAQNWPFMPRIMLDAQEGSLYAFFIFMQYVFSGHLATCSSNAQCHVRIS